MRNLRSPPIKETIPTLMTAYQHTKLRIITRILTKCKNQKPLTVQEFVGTQREETHCSHLAENRNAPSSPIFNDWFVTHWCWARQEQALKIILPLSVRREVLKEEQGSTIFCNLRARCMYDTMRRCYYYSRMANDVYTYAKIWPVCRK